jgi:hypothetical protein
MHTTLDELEQYFDALFLYLKTLGVSSIDLKWDFYWDILYPQRYEVYEKPVEITLGQLSHDKEMLVKLANSEFEPVAYNFVQLAAILRAIGEMGELELLKQANNVSSD